MLTDAELDAMEARCAVPTPGPWKYFGEALMGSITFPDGESIHGVGFKWVSVLWFACHSRTDLPRLIAAYRELRRELSDLMARVANGAD